MKKDLSKRRPIPRLAIPEKKESSVDEVPYHRSNRPSHTSRDLCSPTLSEEDLEAVRTALWYGQLQTVVPYTPDNG